ncbi:helix-turn-helix domain-containing protein [Candidatus Palauibacter sp.]|uniref:helix-turn-helix domain-containing protein n=1 Tax=Candidatus Palauibacter sp. TaxID=3101350 RepID=UPI003B5CAEB0
MTTGARLAGRLRRAREECGLSQQQVADALGLPRTSLSKMEGGTRNVSTLELTKLIDLYGFPASYFLASDDEPRPEDMIHVLRRAVPEMARDPEVGHAVRFGATLCREGASLRRLLGGAVEPAVPNYAARTASASDAIRQGEAIAREERRRLGLGDTPVSNMADLVDDQGIWTAATHLPDSLSGLFVNHAAAGFAIMVNRRHGPVRQRFAYAHEYAHALFDRSRTVVTSRRDNASERGETRANAFAAAFIMPPGGVAERLRRIGKGRPSRHTRAFFDVANDVVTGAVVRERPGSQRITYADVGEIARHFKVGFEAALSRLKSLKHTSAAESAALLDQRDIGNRYIRLLGEPGRTGARDADGHRHLRAQIVRLVIEAFRQEAISRGRLLEIGRKLAIDDGELLDLAWAARPY